jgi:hypothetical protein
MRGASYVSFDQDHDGRTAIVSGIRGTPGTQAVELVWVLLDGGTVLDQRTIDRATGGGVLNGTGLVAVPMQKGGLSLVDLINHKTVTLPESEAWFSGFDRAGFSDTTLVLLRKPEGSTATSAAVDMERSQSFEVVSVDARQLIDSLGQASESPR